MLFSVSKENPRFVSADEQNKENNVFKDGIGVKGLRFKLHGNNHGNHDKHYQTGQTKRAHPVLTGSHPVNV